MVIMGEKNLRLFSVQSSKGNQLKWERDGIWYKADYMGYEGLAEYIVSKLLHYSNLGGKDYILYDTEEISYKANVYHGCKSYDFLPDGWQLITLERLFHTLYGQSLYQSVYQISGIEERAIFLTEQVEQMTGLKNFGTYLARLLTVDAVFLNEDRHMHNIAVLCDASGCYHYCPIFDNGSALLSDVTMDYPMGKDILELIPQAEAKTLSFDFDEQLEAIERLHGRTISFSYNEKNIIELLENEKYYSIEIKNRVRDILLQQRRKYSYLFQC